MSVLDQFGVGKQQLADLGHVTVKYPPIVKGRVAHIDADFMSYQVSAESKAELDPDDPTPRKTFEDMLHNAREAVDHIRLLAGARTAVLHVTHESDKGGREQDAILKPYQANRKDRDRPEHLDEIRVYLGSGCGDTTGTFTGIIHQRQEADDGMAQAHYADPENAVVCSADKDLLMVPGWKLDMYSNTVYHVDTTFGHIELDRSKSSPKVKGSGTKFFWAQCLMGDSADNIQGLPECPGAIWQEYDGTKAHADVLAQWIACNDPVQSAKLSKKLQALRAKTKKCGPILTYNLLKDCRTDAECFNLVKSAFVSLERDHGYEYRHWRTNKRVTPTQALLSEMRLLWMRRYDDRDDVLKWIKEIKK